MHSKSTESISMEKFSNFTALKNQIKKIEIITLQYPGSTARAHLYTSFGNQGKIHADLSKIQIIQPDFEDLLKEYVALLELYNLSNKQLTLSQIQQYKKRIPTQILWTAILEYWKPTTFEIEYFKLDENYQVSDSIISIPWGKHKPTLTSLSFENEPAVGSPVSKKKKYRLSRVKPVLPIVKQQLINFPPNWPEDEQYITFYSAKYVEAKATVPYTKSVLGKTYQLVEEGLQVPPATPAQIRYEKLQLYILRKKQDLALPIENIKKLRKQLAHILLWPLKLVYWENGRPREIYHFTKKNQKSCATNDYKSCPAS